MARTVADRFWEKVDASGGRDACWVWLAARDTRGYGCFWIGGRPVKAHRQSFKMLVQDIPNGIELDHACRLRSCVNPRHLSPMDRVLNCQNLSGARSDSKTGVRGVGWHKRRCKYVVTVRISGVRHSGGYFTSLEDAEAAAIALRLQLMSNNLADRTGNTPENATGVAGELAQKGTSNAIVQ